MSMNGILLLGRDEVIESRAKRLGLGLARGDVPAVPFEKTLITRPGTRVPWGWLEAAWGLLEGWDAAVPLWKYDATAESVGTVDDRERTRAVVRDLRVLLHATDLLFVRTSEAGVALVEQWNQECSSGGDHRLAFLRAFYHVKPRLCVLPVVWVVTASSLLTSSPSPRAERDGNRKRGDGMVQVEIAPGQFVKCFAGDEEKVRGMFEGGRRMRR